MASVTYSCFSLLFFVNPLLAQVIIRSSSSSTRRLDLPFHPSPQPTNQTVWTSHPPRGRTDVPIKVIFRDRPTTIKRPPTVVIEDGSNKVQQGRRRAPPTPQSDASFISVLSTRNLSSGLVLTHPTASRPRTDTASLASMSASARGEAPTKGLNPRPNATPSTDVIDSAGFELVQERSDEKAPRAQEEDGDQQEVGSGSFPTEMYMRGESPDSLATVGNEMAQFRQQAAMMVSEGPSSKSTVVEALQAANQTEKPLLSALTTVKRTSTTASPATRVTLSPAMQDDATVLTANTHGTDRTTPRQVPSTIASLPAATTTLGTTVKQLLIAGQLGTTNSPTNAQPKIFTQEGKTRITTNTITTVQEGARPSSQTTNPPTKATDTGVTATTTTILATVKTGRSPILTTAVLPGGQRRLGSTHQSIIGQKNLSVLLGHPHIAPTFPPSNPTPSPSLISSTNGTLLHWDDLSRTLAFAWELHVYGSASLFILLFAGAALGLTLSPGTNCPHRGALALANALLFLAGGIRSALFVIDPYGTRLFLPRPAVIALYNLPLHMLLWSQAALTLLSLRVAGVSVLPTTLERPPLVAVLAVLQCTLLLAADLLSPALSPAVPVTLQVLSICWGLTLCLGFLCYVFPRIRCPSIPHPGVPEEARRKPWTGSRRTGVILGRVLAVCGLLGTLCCGLHIHATLWLYGLLGNWKHFSWSWWLVHFWARLLELAWGFFLLLLGSWVFWRPQNSRGRDEGAAGDGRAGGDPPSPCQSSVSTHRHTCWSKIVQSLKGKPYRKSESNGVGGGGCGGGGGGSRGGGGGGAQGEFPNNWPGQERPGADISKSLIRNQNHEQASDQQRCVKDSNRGRNQRGRSAERGVSDGSTGSLLRLQALGRPPQRSLSGTLEPDRDTGLSLYEFDLRPPSPIDLSRSIDNALHREHLLVGGSLFQHLSPQSPSPSQGSGVSPGPWLRRNSDPQLLSESSDAQTESSMPLEGSVISSVPSRQVTAPPTPSHQGHRWDGDRVGSVPSSVSCPVSLRPARTSTGHLAEEAGDDTRPFITPDSERVRGRPGKKGGSRSYLEVSRQDDSVSVSSEIIDL